MRPILPAVAAAALLSASCAQARGPAPIAVRLTPEEIVNKPVSPMIYGNFVELGFGRQVEGMWAQMFFNPSFEKVPPYNDIHWFWLSRNPQSDLTVEEWWHSGYEEKSWYLVPGNGESEWRLFDFGGICHGQQGGWLLNKSESLPAAFAQDGLYIHKGEIYRMRGWFRAATQMWDLGPGNVKLDAEVRLYKEGDLQSEPLAKVPLQGIGQSFELREFDITAGDYEGRATFSVWIPAASNLNVDGFSLVPASNVKGWRADVVELSKRVKPRVLRWPGGCFASFYRWREGIGPIEDRQPMPSVFWGGLNDNLVGTREFIEFCRMVEAEPFICINMITGSPAEAAEWVAYCNAPASHAVGALRAKDGYADPFNVKLWELDNETYRRWGPLGYAEACVQYSRAMKAVDPTIRTVMVAYANFQPHLEQMLEIAGKDIDLVTDRATTFEELSRDLEIIRRYNQKTGRNIQLCNTEWLAQVNDVPAKADEYNRQPLPADVTIQNRQIRWRYAMNAARDLLMFQRLGGDFHFANFNNYANTWGQNVIECPKEGAYLSSAGLVFELYTDSPAAWPLKLDAGGLPQDVVVQSSLTLDRKGLVVDVLNYRTEEVVLEVELAALGIELGSWQDRRLIGQSLTSHLTPASPDAVRRTESSGSIRNDRLKITAEPFSVIQVVAE